MVPPELWHLAHRLVRGERRALSSPLQPPAQPTALNQIIFSPTTDSPLWVPAEKVVNRAGQSFTTEQHHFVRYLAFGPDGLESFYQTHKPATVLQFYFLHENLPNPSGPKLLDSPWEHAPPTEEAAPVRAPHLFGPVSQLELAAEAARLDRVAISIEKKGFLDGPPTQPGGHIRAQLLLHENGDFRIQIINGNHRTAVLVHRGWKLIPTHPKVGHPPVRLSDLASWPGVLDGRFAPKTARAIFESFFRDRHQKLLTEW